MEKRKKLLSAILSVSMIASAFTALPLSASAEGEQNSGEEVTATVSPSTTAGVTTTGEPVATATTEVESTDEPATAATPEAAGVVYEDQKIKITAYCRIFLDTNVMPLCRADLSLTNNVMTIPRRIAKTGPPIIGKIFPKIQLGIAIIRHNSTPFQFFLIKFIFITSLKIF